MKDILYMPVNRASMAEILKGGNNLHFRRISNYWQSRLIKDGEVPHYRLVEFRNGYNMGSPRIQFEFKGVYHHEGHYQIKLGECVWKNDQCDLFENGLLNDMLAASIKYCGEVEEIQPEDLEAAADYFDRLENEYKSEHQNDYYEQ